LTTRIARLLAVALLAANSCPARSAQGEGNNRFACETATDRIIVDGRGADRFRFRSWSKTKAISAAPDRELASGTEGVEGSGVCVHRIWTFRQGTTLFSVAEIGCADSAAPEDAIGVLVVTRQGRAGEVTWCR
jgi:hypothetical protein